MRDLTPQDSNEKLLVSLAQEFSLASIRWWVAVAKNLLEQVGIETAELEARMFLEQVLSMERIDILLGADKKINHQEALHFLELLKRRLCFEPIAYILGYKEFYGHRFMVNEHCLIPRPDTECVVEQCLNLLKGHNEHSVFDICTGSGAIGQTIAKELPGAQVIGTDISLDALAMAQKNAHALGLEKSFSTRHGDLLGAFNDDEKAFLIVSNPPYIGERDYKNLATTVKDFEPQGALLSGDFFGLKFYERLLEEAGPHLLPKGFLVLEIGYDQAQAIKELSLGAWRVIDVVKDLAGNDRCMILQSARKE